MTLLVDLDEITVEEARLLLHAVISRGTEPPDQTEQLAPYDAVRLRANDPAHIDFEATAIVRQRVAEMEAEVSA
jgi:hypothetical protein